MSEKTEALLTELSALVRRRFPNADGVVCSHSADDTVLWQVTAGGQVIWDALPAVTTQIPNWDRLPDAVGLLRQVANGRSDVGDLIAVQLAD